jgi:hypothetical protein
LQLGGRLLVGTILERGKQCCKKEATASLREFLDTFRDFSERAEWTKRFLATHKFGSRIYYELFQEVIFPVLLDGYQKNDAWSMYWLAGTAEDLVRGAKTRCYYEQFGGTIKLLKTAMALDNTARVRDALLQEFLICFDYAGHEWPAGILSGDNGSTAAECDLYLDDIRLARKLDIDQKYSAQLDEFEDRVRLYLGKLAYVQEQK